MVINLKKTFPTCKLVSTYTILDSPTNSNIKLIINDKNIYKLLKREGHYGSLWSRLAGNTS